MADTLEHSLAEVEAEKQGNRLRDVEAKSFSDTLSDRLAEVKVGKVGETLTDLYAASPVLTQAATLAVMKLSHRSAHPAWPPQARPVVKTLAGTVAKKT